MSPVAVVSIVVGVLAVCTRAPLVVAPRSTLRWSEDVFRTNARVRFLGTVLLALTATMVWAGNSEDSALASLLLLFGLGGVAICGALLLPFPGLFRALVAEILPPDPAASLIGWRLVGLTVVIGGVLLIYLGVHAL